MPARKNRGWAALAGMAAALVAAEGQAQTSDAPTTLDLSFTEDSLRLALGQVTNYQAINAEGTRSAFDGGVVLRERGQDSDRGFFGGAYVEGGIANSPLTGGVGPRLWVIDSHGDTGGALTVGGYARASLPDVPEAGLRIDGFFSPPVVTANDVDFLQELSFRGEYALFPEATAYVGYRSITFDGSSSYTLDEGLMLGLTLTL